MSFWNKKKNNDAAAVSQISHAIRTMEDDLQGIPFPKGEVSGASSRLASNTPSSQVLPTASEAKKSPVNGIHTNVPNNLPTSPFLGDGSGSEPTAFIQPEKGTVTPIPPVEQPGVPQNTSLGESSPSKRRSLYLWLGIILGILLIGGGASYYYFAVWKKSAVVPEPTVSISDMETNQPEAQAETPVAPPTTPRYSATTPNLLSINTETVTAESLHTTLLEAAQTVKESELPGAVEFLVRDQNYNPLAFSRFAYLAKIDLPADLLTQIDEQFSLFVVIDADRPHIGLLVHAKNTPLFLNELSKAEKTLPLAISPLFIDMTTAPKTGLLFKSGTYGGLTTRYTNIDSAINLSVDYATKDSLWILGTSRDTLRAIIDKEETTPAK